MSVLKNGVRVEDEVSQEAKPKVFNKYTILMIFELLVSALIIGYGIYADSTLMVALGTLSAILSFFQPASRLEKMLLKKMVRK